MRECIYAALVALAALVISPAFAGTNTWSWGSGPGSACADQSSWAGATSCSASWTPGGPSCQVLSSTTKTDNTPPVLSWTANFACGHESQWSFTVACTTGNEWNETYGGCVPICTAPDTLNESTGMCDSPPDCSSVEGREADRFFSDSGPGGAICANPPGSESMDCSAVVANPIGVRACADGECFARIVFTGDQCGAEPDATAETLADLPGVTNCVSGGGVTVCAAQTSTNCGTVNGQPVCLESVPEGRCVFLGNGGLVCGSSAAGPTESDGVTPATPDGTFSAGSEDVAEGDFKYYGPGTVATSGTPISGSSAVDDSDGEEEDDECADGACEGVLPVISEQPTFGASTAAMVSALEATPWGAAIVAPVGDIPTGACPEETFSMFGNTYTIDVACDLWPSLEPILSACFIFAYILIGVRIVASA